MLTAKKKVLFVFKNGDHLFFELATTLKNFGGPSGYQKKKLISFPKLISVGNT